MVYVKSFQGIRPAKEFAKKVSALPYDVMNRYEAKEMAEGNDISILHITRAEIDFSDSVNDYDPSVYEKGRDTLVSFLKKGILIKEDKPVFYIYREIMNGKSQTGIVAAVSVDDYKNNLVLKHEFTRKEKEADRIRHFDVCDCQTEPIFLTYAHQENIRRIVSSHVENNEPEYDFISDDSIRHTLWVINEDTIIAELENHFASLEKVYIADGHHRTASAAAIQEIRQNQGKITDKNDPANFVMAVLFPDDELEIMAYNRIVKIEKDFDSDEFFRFLSKNFSVEKIEGDYLPQKKHDFGLYINNSWYKLTSNNSLYCNEDVSENLDAAILQNNVLEPYFRIKDPRTDKKIDFIGGIRGNKEIIRRCKEENAIGFNLFPVQISDLMGVADAGKMMPPKSTWFEPKLRSGLFLHSFEK